MASKLTITSILLFWVVTVLAAGGSNFRLGSYEQDDGSNPDHAQHVAALQAATNEAKQQMGWLDQDVDRAIAKPHDLPSSIRKGFGENPNLPQIRHNVNILKDSKIHVEKIAEEPNPLWLAKAIPSKGTIQVTKDFYKQPIDIQGRLLAHEQSHNVLGTTDFLVRTGNVSPGGRPAYQPIHYGELKKRPDLQPYAVMGYHWHKAAYNHITTHASHESHHIADAYGVAGHAAKPDNKHHGNNLDLERKGAIKSSRYDPKDLSGWSYLGAPKPTHATVGPTPLHTNRPLPPVHVSPGTNPLSPSNLGKHKPLPPIEFPTQGGEASGSGSHHRTYSTSQHGHGGGVVPGRPVYPPTQSSHGRHNSFSYGQQQQPPVPMYASSSHQRQNSFSQQTGGFGQHSRQNSFSSIHHVPQHNPYQYTYAPQQQTGGFSSHSRQNSFSSIQHAPRPQPPLQFHNPYSYNHPQAYHSSTQNFHRNPSLSSVHHPSYGASSAHGHGMSSTGTGNMYQTRPSMGHKRSQSLLLPKRPQVYRQDTQHYPQHQAHSHNQGPVIPGVNTGAPGKSLKRKEKRHTLVPGPASSSAHLPPAHSYSTHHHQGGASTSGHASQHGHGVSPWAGPIASSSHHQQPPPPPPKKSGVKKFFLAAIPKFKKKDKS